MSDSTDTRVSAADILNAAGRFEDARTAEVNEWISKLPRKEFEYVLHLTEREAKRSERLHAATIAAQAALIERLREAIEDHIDYADWQDQDQINRGYTNVTKLRAALQPKEGEG